MVQNGRVASASNEFVNITMNQGPGSGSRRGSVVDAGDISKGQLEVRIKRFREQMKTVEQLVSKLSISVERLEGENESLREQSEYFRRQRNATGKTTTTTFCIPLSAARVAIELLASTVGRIQGKLEDFEKIALADKEKADEAERQNGQLKSIIEEAHKNLKEEKKKNEFLQEKVTFLENEFVKEATQRLAAERRSNSFENQVREMADELSAQSSQTTERDGQLSGSDVQNSGQQLSSDPEEQHSSDSSGSDDVVITSTPHNFPRTPHNSLPRTSTACKHFSRLSWKRAAPQIATRFQNVFSDMEERFRKLKNKVKTITETNTAFINSQGSLLEYTKYIFSWSSHNKTSNSRCITIN